MADDNEHQQTASHPEKQRSEPKGDHLSENLGERMNSHDAMNTEKEVRLSSTGKIFPGEQAMEAIHHGSVIGQFWMRRTVSAQLLDGPLRLADGDRRIKRDLCKGSISAGAGGGTQNLFLHIQPPAGLLKRGNVTKPEYPADRKPCTNQAVEHQRENTTGADDKMGKLHAGNQHTNQQQHAGTKPGKKIAGTTLWKWVVCFHTGSLMMFNDARTMPQTSGGEAGYGENLPKVFAPTFASILLCCLAIVMAASFGGCMFSSINNPKFDKTCLHAGFSGIDHPAIEVGVGNLKYGQKSVLHHTASITRSYAIAARVELGDTAMYAIEGSLWGGGAIGMGLSAAYYTNFTASSFYLRPEFGMGDFSIGPIWLRWGVGYNIRCTHRAVAEMNQPFLNVRVTVPLDTVAIE